MDTSVEKLEGTRVKLTVTLTAKEVDEGISAAYGKIASRVRIPGFRAGKAPRPVIDTHVGKDAVLGEALEDLVEDTYPRALDVENLRPIERPDVGTLDGLEPGADYTFSAEFDTRPQLELSSTKGLKAVVPPSKTSDREIDAQIDYLRDRFATLEPVEDRGVGEHDFALISFVGTVDGESYEENAVDKYLYELGAGQMPKEFDAAMIGAKPGESVRAEFAVPDTSSNPEFVGRTAAFDITVHEIKAKTLPAVDDELAVNVGGFDSMADLREDIRTKLDENKAVGHVGLIEREARATLSDRLVGEIPQALIDSTTYEMTEDFFETLQKRGYTIESYMETTGVPFEQIREDIAVEAKTRVRGELALEALFRAEGLEVTESDVATELGSLAEAEKGSIETVAARLRDAGLMPLLKERIMHRKAVRWLMDNVEVIEEEPSAEGAGGTAESAAEGAGGTEAPAKPPKKRAFRKKAADKPADKPADEEA